MCDRCEKGDHAFMVDLLETIGQFGHAVIYVEDAGDGRERPMSYTVGLSGNEAYGYELAQSGLSPHQSHIVLNHLPEAIAQRKIKPVEGLIIEGVLGGGYNLKLRQVSREDQFGMARSVYGQDPKVWQVVWPDPQNKFPGEPGYNTLDQNLQELL